MDAKTAEALEKSIEHWRRNTEGPIDKASADGDDCALCGMFQEKADDDGFCARCPVSERVQRPFCICTPFEAAFDALKAWKRGRTTENEAAFRAAARDELAFLESLREPIDMAALDAAKE